MPRLPLASSVIALLATLAGAVFAQDGAPDLDETVIGRLEVSGSDQGSCAFTMIGADLALTAANCVVEKGQHGPVDPGRLTLRLSMGEDDPIVFTARDIGFDPAFTEAGEVTREIVARDVALIRLAEPYPGPFERVGPPDIAQAYVAMLPVLVDGTFEPAICPVAYEDTHTLALSCARPDDTAGSPIISMIQGQRTVVGVVSAEGLRADGTPVTFGAAPAEVFSTVVWAVKDRETIDF